MPGYTPYTYPHPLVSGDSGASARRKKVNDQAVSTREQ
jgi:hypothetical protein